jgi:DNA-binding response OmpR family regulator
VAKKILIVDDEPDLLKVLEIRLKNTGYEVFIGADGREALDLARQIMPDLIILDLYLPVKNGDEVAEILKNDEKLKQIPIILISATTEALSERAKECGANVFLTKPFEAQELLAKIESLIR